MCGIAGIIMKNGAAPAPEMLEKLRAALAHRGPDGKGEYTDKNTGLVHLRLAIIDPEGGWQPLYDDNMVLVGNGEIYNYIELKRDELPPANYKTGSDFEPVMKLIARDGMDAFPKLRGMYAQATYTPSDRKTLIARDRYGIKPLYYTETPEFFAFASQPVALLALPGVSKIFAPGGTQRLLQQGYISGAETIYRDIKKLLPGEAMQLAPAKAGVSGTKTRIPTLPAPTQNKLSLSDAIAAFDKIFMESVDLHQRSDVPYGLFLSGGLDSTAVLTMMARLNDASVTSFTCGFDAPNAKDERERAKQIATALGAQYNETTFGEKDFWELLPRVASTLDDPIIDYATLPTFKLAATARAHVKVILSGEGGDEALGGYGRYRKAARPWFLGGGYRARGRFEKMGILRSENSHSSHHLTPPNATRFQSAQAHDFTGWLPDNLLVKLDRCLMAHGIEGRTPLLEPHLTDFCFNLPDEFKTQNGSGKYLLRLWLQQYGPKNIDYFSKKQGFTVPVGDWISARAAALGPLVAKNGGVQEIAHAEKVQSLFTHGGKRETTAAWSLLFYACWHKIHIEGAAPDGDAFALLST